MEQFDYIEEDGITYATLNKRYKSSLQYKRYVVYLKASGIPNFYWDINFCNYQGRRSKDSLRKAQYYSKNFNDEKFNYIHLYLVGINNSQKTAIACNIGKEAIKQDKKVQFVLAGALIDKLLKSQGFTINEEIESYIKKIKECDMLIIDDIFDEKKSIHWKSESGKALVLTAWDNFLREVVSSNTKIIMTSNIPIENIETKFGESMYHLIDRNFLCLSFYDSIKEIKKKKYENLFEEL